MKFIFSVAALLTVLSTLAHASETVMFQCDQFQKSAPQIVQKEDGNFYLKTSVIYPGAKPSYEALVLSSTNNGSTYVGSVHTFLVHVIAGRISYSLYFNDASNVTPCYPANN